MTANLRYLNASFFSFCFHAIIFLYLYGTFDSNASQTLLISKPLMVELKFELDSLTANNEIQPTAKLDEIPPLKPQDLITNPSESLKLSTSIIKEPPIYSNLSDLLEQEKNIVLYEQDEQIFFYSQKIIQTIEDAWMKPRNIPEGLVANLRLNIQPTGRISRVDLLKFFNEMPAGLYRKEFKRIAVSFKPS
jgi:hypothetical protein